MISDCRDEAAYERARRPWVDETWPQRVRQAQATGAVIRFVDEVSLALWGSLSDTWAPRGQQPLVKTTGIRKGLNLPAGRMSASPDDPRHFSGWLSRWDAYGAGHFVPRKLYGIYIQAVLETVITQASANARLDRIRGAGRAGVSGNIKRCICCSHPATIRTRCRTRIRDSLRARRADHAVCRRLTHGTLDGTYYCAYNYCSWISSLIRKKLRPTRLQAERGGKSRITIRVDNATLAFFKARAEMAGSHYQTLMNEALQQFAQGQTLADVVRDTLREELRRAYRY